jgi:hypothetical protein
LRSSWHRLKALGRKHQRFGHRLRPRHQDREFIGSYKVQRWWDKEPEYRAMIGVLPPGRWTISLPESGGAIVDVKLGGSAAMSRVMVIISFTDNAGNHWARGARGELRQLRAPAIEYWKIRKEDIDWRVPTRLD